MRTALVIAISLVLLAGSVFGARDFANAGGNVFSTNTWYGGTITNFTISVWARHYPPYGGGGRPIVLVSDQSAAKAIYVLRTGSASSFSGGHVDGASTSVGSGTVTSNDWHHVALVRTSTTNLRLFVDGVVVGTNTTAQTYSSGWATNYAVGNYAQNLASGSPYQGSAAEAAIWGVGLSDGEIAALAAGLSPVRVRPSALMTYLPLYGHGGTTNPEIDVIRGPLGRYGGTTNPVEVAHPKIYR